MPGSLITLVKLAGIDYAQRNSHHGRQSWGLRGRDPQILGRGSWTGREILLRTGSMLESGDF